MNQLGIFDICHKRHKGNAASKAANPRAASKQQTHEQILAIFRRKGNQTSKDIAQMLNKPLNAISGRLSELKLLGKIRGTGERRDGSEILELL